jgi:predicted nucleotidyltransferase component of viral defense system
MTRVRRVHSIDDLRDIAEQLSLPVGFVDRDYVLATIAAQLVDDFGSSLCFKGGFVLRHAYGLARLSIDLDATRLAPPREPMDAQQVRASIASAARGSLFSLRVREPQTDSPRSLDFSAITYRGLAANPGEVAVEVSYREAVVLDPHQAMIGPPYYEPFPIPVLQPQEFAAEKLRTLAQRRRPTDLADLAFILDSGLATAEAIAPIVPYKFEKGLVRPGNPVNRITEAIDDFARSYDETVPDLAPGAMPYQEARDVVLARLGPCLTEL